MIHRLIAGALALVCVVAFASDAQARHARRHHAARQLQSVPPGRAGPSSECHGTTYDNDGRTHCAGGLPGFVPHLLEFSPSSDARPRDCYGIAWCGCWLRHQLGLADRALNVAINWARIGQAATPDTANVAVWPHHVGRVLDYRAGMILLQSGNDGHAVRTRWRPVRGVVAWRRV